MHSKENDPIISQATVLFCKKEGRDVAKGWEGGGRPAQLRLLCLFFLTSVFGVVFIAASCLSALVYCGKT
jgi:hypothetical protein